MWEHYWRVQINDFKCIKALDNYKVFDKSKSILSIWCIVPWEEGKNNFCGHFTLFLKVQMRKKYPWSNLLLALKGVAVFLVYLERVSFFRFLDDYYATFERRTEIQPPIISSDNKKVILPCRIFWTICFKAK